MLFQTRNTQIGYEKQLVKYTVVFSWYCSESSVSLLKGRSKRGLKNINSVLIKNKTKNKQTVKNPTTKHENKMSLIKKRDIKKSLKYFKHLSIVLSITYHIFLFIVSSLFSFLLFPYFLFFMYVKFCSLDKFKLWGFRQQLSKCLFFTTGRWRLKWAFKTTQIHKVLINLLMYNSLFWLLSLLG